MNESQITREFRKAIETEFKSLCWIKKMTGGQFTEAGMPDLIACINSLFVGLEIKYVNKPPKRNTSKLLKNKVTKDQIMQLKAINNAGGLGEVIIFVRTSHQKITGFIADPKNVNNLTVEDMQYRIDYSSIVPYIFKKNGRWYNIIETINYLYANKIDKIDKRNNGGYLCI